MQFSTTISLGDIAAVLVVFGGVVAFYSRITTIEYKVEELRRGRGLILEHWPVAVQRCFGYRNGNTRTEA